MCERCKLTVLKPYYITYKGGEIINNKDLEDLKSVISDLKASDTDVDALQNEIKKKGLEKEVNDFTKKYGSQIKKFMHDLDNKGSLDTEEKAKMVMQLQEKMTPEQQKQFKSVVNTLKDYLKKRKG